VIAVRVYGCDFSGAKDAAQKICVCEATLEGDQLVLQCVNILEERLDLLYLLQTRPGVWGIDMPFSLPKSEVERFGGWRATLSLANQMDRMQFKSLFPVRHSRSSERSMFRATDVAVSAKSPISSTPLDMLGMTYGAFKILDQIVLNEKIHVYPFMDPADKDDTFLCEVYPRCMLNTLGFAHKELQLDLLLQRFAERIDADFSMKYDEQLSSQLKSEHAWDAVLACITLAYCLWKQPFHLRPFERPGFLSDDEWQLRQIEGAIVRMSIHT
jgi:hypothetical protein